MNRRELSIAMLGMVDGNGHPYSWSAMFNGYDREAMADCPFPVIPVYLGNQPPETFGIPGAKITHIWTDDPEDAKKVARASKIPNVVARAEDVIGEVDAVIIATDKGLEHVDRCRPFVEAGLPMFVDKPLADTVEDLKVFSGWVNDGAMIMSSSSQRYAKELMPYHGGNYHELGELRFVSVPMPKSWERYGIHALEAVYPITGPGYISVRNTGEGDRNIVHLKHACGADIVLATVYDMGGGFGFVDMYGTIGNIRVKCGDSYRSFKNQLDDFVKYLHTGVRPYPFTQTEELTRIIAGGIMSRQQGGREIMLEELEG